MHPPLSPPPAVTIRQPWHWTLHPCSLCSGGVRSSGAHGAWAGAAGEVSPCTELVSSPPLAEELRALENGDQVSVRRVEELVSILLGCRGLFLQKES